VRLAEAAWRVTAKGADPDTLVASAKSYLAALHKLMSRRPAGPSRIAGLRSAARAFTEAGETGTTRCVDYANSRRG